MELLYQGREWHVRQLGFWKNPASMAQPFPRRQDLPILPHKSVNRPSGGALPDPAGPANGASAVRGPAGTPVIIGLNFHIIILFIKF